uniref:integrin beta-2-like n=1 Tax=Myxine glutinosa TaxID=7769 RepID=UPI00358F9F55
MAVCHKSSGFEQGLFCHLLLFLWIITGSFVFSSELEMCESKNAKDCKACIKQGPGCSWCKSLNFEKHGEGEAVRCGTRKVLMERGCTDLDIVSPRGLITVEKDDPLTGGEVSKSVVQLRPQIVRLKLRPGKEMKFDIDFQRAEGYPIDLYYLMDLSYSMNDDLENVKKLGTQLLEAMQKVTKSVKIGFGAFVDKTVLPFVSTNKQKLKHPCPKKNVQCSKPFGYRHVLNLTDDSKRFTNEVGNMIISGNLDSPEGGFDAIMQAAVCGDKIGWRDNTRLLVYTSDAGFHFAGDGKLAGIVQPNDGKCHIGSDLEKSSISQDYPSVGQLTKKLSENNIQAIFAVTKGVVNTYKSLQQFIPKSAVGELSEDSSNVVQLITDAYNNLSSNIIIQHNSLPAGLTVKYLSTCGNDTVTADRGECSNVKIGQKLQFQVFVKADTCPESNQTEFEIKALGLQEKLKVIIEYDCECNCDAPEHNSRNCDKHGTLHCGTCRCNDKWQGRWCNCSLQGTNAKEIEDKCKRGNESQICSNHGDCLCGTCECQQSEDSKEIIGGKFCECNNLNCPRFNNSLCGGQGKCWCDRCECNPGFTGNACDCPVDKSQCVAPSGKYSGLTCSGRGVCKCGTCSCFDIKYYGKYCELCRNCRPCIEHRDCVECKTFHSGPLAENCTTCAINVTTLKSLEGAKGAQCEERNGSSCIMKYKIDESSTTTIISVLEDIVCPQPPSALTIVPSVLAGVVFIGLLLLLAWKLLTTVYDHREYKKFEMERSQAKWNKDDNPLYKSATTTVVNPKFDEN